MTASSSTPTRPYRYDRFVAADYDLSRFDSPQLGDPAPTVVATDQHGRTIDLADLRGQWVVLELGSLTCNMFASNNDRMQDLADRYDDVTFAVLYVREAHPGRRIGQPGDLEEKRANARQLGERLGMRREIWVDDLDGDAHRAFGALPNSVFVIDPAGRIAYRRDWTVTSDLADFLADRTAATTDDRTTTRQLLVRRPNLGAVLRAGTDALLDVLKALPALARSHLATDRGR